MRRCIKGRERVVAIGSLAEMSCQSSFGGGGARGTIKVVGG